MWQIKFNNILLCFIALSLLAACTSVPQTHSGIEHSPQSQPFSLAALERSYNQNPESVTAAIDYADALRDADYLNRAAIVLAPFVNSGKPSGAALVEYSAVQLDLGNYITAEEYAQKAIIQNPENYQAYHFLGIALDAQNLHEPAENAFRKALEYWQGDATAVMNDLALNLTTQEKLDEAAEILDRAATLAPNDKDIERNLRILRALQQSHAPRAPKPAYKPPQH